MVSLKKRKKKNPQTKNECDLNLFKMPGSFKIFRNANILGHII